MSRDIIEMAQESGFETRITKGRIHGFDRDGDYTEELKAFAELVRADEREACAALSDKVVEGKLWFNDLPAAIRARNQI
jgi:hypothetical protein